MPIELHRLSLFGFDLASLGKLWQAGWRELIWGRESAIRRAIDAPISLSTGDELRWFVAEMPLEHTPSDPAQHFEALLIPSERVLFSELLLPLTREADLESAVALEVRASSPFPAADTCFGWALCERREGRARVLLAMTAVSEATAFMRTQGRNVKDHDALPELWCRQDTEGPVVVLRGFGEGRRCGAYRRRLRYLAGGIFMLFLLVSGLFHTPGLVRKLQADNMDFHLAYAEAEAAEAIRLRDQLAVNNDRAVALQELLNEQFNVHGFLESLTELTPDGVYLEQLTIEGRQVRLRGWAEKCRCLHAAGGRLSGLHGGSRTHGHKAPWSDQARAVRVGV